MPATHRAMVPGSIPISPGSTAENFQLGRERMTEDQAKLDASVTHSSVMIASDSVFWFYFDENGGIQNYLYLFEQRENLS